MDTTCKRTFHRGGEGVHGTENIRLTSSLVAAASINFTGG